MRENIYMLPSVMNQNIKSGVVNCNNKILISDSEFVLWKNDRVNTLKLAKISHKVILQPIITHKNLAQEPTQTITHKEEKLP